MHTAVLNLADLKGWDTRRFAEAYARCLAGNLEVMWLFGGKLFRSPNRQYFFALEHKVDFGSYEVYEVLYDRNQQVVARRICFKDVVPVFSISQAARDADSQRFCYRFGRA